MSAAQEFLNTIGRNLRPFTKNPGLTAAAVTMLALGIGASTSIFSILWAVAIGPIPYDHAEQLVMLWRTESAIPQMQVSGPDFLDLAKQSTTLSTVAAAASFRPVRTSGGAKERLSGFRVTPDFFKVLHVQAAAGRLFAAGDDQPGHDHVVILGKPPKGTGVGRDLPVIGGTLTLDNQEYEVIGRVPESFRFPAIEPMMEAEYDVYVPIPTRS